MINIKKLLTNVETGCINELTINVKIFMKKCVVERRQRIMYRIRFDTKCCHKTGEESLL